MGIKQSITVSEKQWGMATDSIVACQRDDGTFYIRLADGQHLTILEESDIKAIQGAIDKMRRMMGG